MVIDRLSLITNQDIGRFAWSGLGKFTARHIEAIQGAPIRQGRNVRKQAEQVRYCLIQARGYFQAAERVSLATKPLLLYYGIMSLALAEVLTKQSGDSSLDRAREHHNHHGLQLRIIGNPSQSDDLLSSAEKLGAAPLIKGSGDRSGTFELWHRSSRETPLCGPVEHHLANGTMQKRIASVVAIGEDLRPPLLAENGLTLLQCFRCLPCMAPFISQYGITPALARASLNETTRENPAISVSTLTFHPGDSAILEAIYGSFYFKPADFECLAIREMPSGLIVQQTHGPNYPHSGARYPYGFQSTPDEIMFCAENNSLNEFGLFYAAMYILGNYARYYPDQWMKDVEEATPLALAAEEFISTAEERAPLLTLGELARIYYLSR